MRRPHLMVAILLIVAPPAVAEQQQIDDGSSPTVNFAGDSNNLPVRCSLRWDDAVAWARGMNSVRAAITEFQRRGYIAHPSRDTAVVDCHEGVTGVVLAWEKLGAFIDSFHVAAPMIVVATRVDRINGAVSTHITAGIYVSDGQRWVSFAGDSLPMFAGDQSFDMAPRDGRSPEEVTDAAGWDAVTNPNSGLSRWARCSGWGTIGCIAGVMRFGGPNFTPIKIAAIMAAPEIGLGILAGCSLSFGIGCLGTI